MNKIKLNYEKYVCEYVNKLYPNKFSSNNNRHKYSIEKVVNTLYYILKSGVSYRDCISKMSKSAIHYHANFFAKHNIFKKVYCELLTEYANTGNKDKFKLQSTDTSFIPNNNGISKIGRNKYYRNKRGSKLSVIVDSNGIPISCNLYCGNVNDAVCGATDIKHFFINVNTNKYDKSNRYIHYIMGDKAYDSKKLRKLYTELGYTPIIDFNRRNTQNPDKIKTLT